MIERERGEERKREEERVKERESPTDKILRLSPLSLERSLSLSLTLLSESLSLIESSVCRSLTIAHRLLSKGEKSKRDEVDAKLSFHFEGEFPMRMRQRTHGRRDRPHGIAKLT
jgi:hypothetical protein